MAPCGMLWPVLSVAGKALFLAVAGLLVGLSSPYGALYEFPAASCDGPALPANHSGLQVLIYGPSKVGTKQMSQALMQLGVRYSYHSEDFIYMVWHRLTQDFWRRKGGRQGPRSGRASENSAVELVAGVDKLVADSDLDLQVAQGIEPEVLAASISRCGARSLSFDGAEELFWPVYNVSPGVKVLSMNWRAYPLWRKSWDDFIVWAQMYAGLAALVHSPIHLTPVGALLIRGFEYLEGNTIQHRLRAGGPEQGSGNLTVGLLLWMWQTIPGWYLPHTNAGLRYTPPDEESYDQYFADARRRIPAERLFEFDVNVHTFKDLCTFLELRGPALCESDETLPNDLPNYGNIEGRAPNMNRVATALLLILHVVQYKLLHFAWRSLCERRRKSESKRD